MALRATSHAAVCDEANDADAGHIYDDDGAGDNHYGASGADFVVGGFG